MNKVLSAFTALALGALSVSAGNVIRDIPYDASIGNSGLGDLYLPDRVSAQTPMVLIIHGGGWSGLDRPSVAGIADFFCRELGFAAFNIEYRLANAANRWPACGDDCVKAADFILNDAFKAQYGLAYDKIWICGGSAGGHLTLWTLVKLDSAKVAGAVSISSIGDPDIDFAANAGRYNALFDAPVTAEKLDTMDPIPRVRAGMAPLLCTHADTDAVVPIASHRAFATAYANAGNRCDFFEYAHDCEANEGGHFIWRPGSNPHKLLAVLENRIRLFVQSVHGVSAGPVEITAGALVRYTAAGTAVQTDVYSQGSLRKNSEGTLTLVSPGLGGAGELVVEKGDVDIDYHTTPAPSGLPAALTAKIKLWLDPAVNMFLEDGRLKDWFDCREADLSAAVKTYPYASSRFHYMTEDYYKHSISAIAPPDIVSKTEALPYLDFGSYGNDLSAGKGLSITNSGVAKGLIYAREVFAVFRRGSASATGLGTLFSCSTGGMDTPSWVGATDKLWGSTINTRADKGSTRLDREPVNGAFVPLHDSDWHLVSCSVPLPDTDCKINQLGIDRVIAIGGMHLGEVIMCETRLSEAERMRIEDYLWRKWFGGRVGTFGEIAVGAASKVTLDTASDASGGLAGGGAVEIKGAGTVTTLNHGFSGKLTVANGIKLRNDDIPLAIDETSRDISVYDAGYVMGVDGTVDDRVWINGNGRFAFGSFAPGTKSLLMSGTGTFRLAPPAGREEVAAAADFPNHDMEAWANVSSGSSIYNYAGGAGQAPVTNNNWVFDRSMWSSGGALAVVMFTNSYLRTSDSWNTQTRPDIGLGWDGRCWIYLCKGDVKGFFTVPTNGFYSLQFRVSSRSAAAHKDVTLKLDGQELRHVTSFDWTQFLRYEAELPYLTAGRHEICFSGNAEDSSPPTYTFDDMKVLPRRIVATESVRVSIVNPSFEEPLSNQGKASSDIGTVRAFIPSQADCTGWAMSSVTTPSSSAFVTNWIRRRWFEGNTDFARGMAATPEEFPDGFLAALVVGDAKFAQTVSIPSAGRYRLSFWLARRVGMSPQLMKARVGGQIVKQAWVRHPEFKRYEAVFDIAAEGDLELSFEGGGDATSSTIFARGGAWLDDIALERIGDTPPNLVVNGGFENGSGAAADSWLMPAGCSRVNAVADGLFHGSQRETAIAGTDGAMLYGANGALRQLVDFPSTGRYELSFSLRQFRRYPKADEINTFHAAVSTRSGSTNILYRCEFFDNQVERRLTLPFVVTEAGRQTLEFYLHTPGAATDYVLIDDVEIVATAPVTRSDLGDFIPPTMNVEIGGNNGTPNVILDFDGVAKIDSFTYGGRHYTGEISHERMPQCIFGRGRFYVMPKGTIIVCR